MCGWKRVGRTSELHPSRLWPPHVLGNRRDNFQSPVLSVTLLLFTPSIQGKPSKRHSPLTLGETEMGKIKQLAAGVTAGGRIND